MVSRFSGSWMVRSRAMSSFLRFKEDFKFRKNRQECLQKTTAGRKPKMPFRARFSSSSSSAGTNHPDPCTKVSNYC